MTISVASVIMFLGLVSLLLATLGLPDFARYRFFPGGMLLWGISLFVTFAAR